MAALSVTDQEVLEFLRRRFGQVEGLERLGGGFWSAAYAFRADGRQLVARFGQDRSWFEADRAAMSFARPGLPVPEVLDVGEAFNGAYAISVRHEGIYLEDVTPEQAPAAGPMLTGLLEALFQVPRDLYPLVGWHWQPPQPEVGWRDWLLASSHHDAGRDPIRWEARLSADPDLETLFRTAEARIRDLAPACPERRDLVHGDLLHGNVLVSEDASKVHAVFSWKCSVRGDFLYDVAWCTFWGGVHPGIAAAEPWTAAFSSELIGREPAALIDAPERHHCYELQIGVSHLGWNVWVGNEEALSETTGLLVEALERGPLARPRPSQRR